MSKPVPSAITPPRYFDATHEDRGHRIVLHVSDCRHLNQFIDFLRLVYAVRIRRPQQVIAGVWRIQFTPAPHYSLAGVRVASRLYHVSYDVIEIG